MTLLCRPRRKSTLFRFIRKRLSAADATLTGAILCSGASVKRGGSMFEAVQWGASRCWRGGKRAPDVLIWPGKTVGDGPLYRKM